MLSISEALEQVQVSLVKPHLFDDTALMRLNVYIADWLLNQTPANRAYRLAGYTCLMLTREFGGLDIRRRRYTDLLAQLHSMLNMSYPDGNHISALGSTACNEFLAQ